MQQETDGEVSNLSDISAGVGLRHLVKASSTAIREQSTHTHTHTQKGVLHKADK